MWLFGTLLPQMIGHKVPSDDEHWETVHFLLAPQITDDDVVLLSTMISDYVHEFKSLYPRASISPKMQYLIHAHGNVNSYVSLLIVVIVR